MPRHAFFTIWFKPRETIRSLVAERPGYSVLILAMLAFVARALDNGASSYPNVPAFSILSFVMLILVSAVMGLGFLYVFGFLLSRIGRVAGGKGDARSLRTAYAWASVPGVCTIPVSCAVLLLLWTGVPLFEFLYFFLFLTALALIVWQLVLQVAGVSAAHRFSIVRAVGTWMLSVVLLVAVVATVLIPSIFLWAKYFPRNTSSTEVAAAAQEVQRRIERYLDGDPEALPFMFMGSDEVQDIIFVEATPGIRGQVDVLLEVDGRKTVAKVFHVGGDWHMLPGLDPLESEEDIKTFLAERIERYLNGETDALPITAFGDKLNVQKLSIEDIRKGDDVFGQYYADVRAIYQTDKYAAAETATLEVYTMPFMEWTIMPILLGTELSAGVRKGQKLDITGPILNGGNFDLEQFRGNVVFVYFWASWCDSCLAGIQELKRAYDRLHEEGFEVLGVSLDDTPEALARFVRENNIPWPQVFYSEQGDLRWNNPLIKKYGIEFVPLGLLLDREGVVSSVSGISVYWPLFEHAVVNLLDKGKRSRVENLRSGLSRLN